MRNKVEFNKKMQQCKIDFREPKNKKEKIRTRQTSQKYKKKETTRQIGRCQINEEEKAQRSSRRKKTARKNRISIEKQE